MDFLLDLISQRVDTLNDVVFVCENGHIGNADDELKAYVYAFDIISGQYSDKNNLDLLGRLFFNSFEKVPYPSEILVRAKNKVNYLIAL